jgi:hypothetical protein
MTLARQSDGDDKEYQFLASNHDEDSNIYNSMCILSMTNIAWIILLADIHHHATK